MLYTKLQFPQLSDRPYFYTNFVTTLDGKVQVTTTNSQEYWPIGSETDFQTLLDLRSYADILIHGKQTTLAHRTIDRIASLQFQKLRAEKGIQKPLRYMVISNHPGDELVEILKDSQIDKPIVVTSEKAVVSENLFPHIELVRIGKEKVDIEKLSAWLFKNGFKLCLMEGGPHLFGEFLKVDLIDEFFITIAPKIFGNAQKSTISLVEGVLFKPDEVKQLKLVSVKPVGNEIYLRYIKSS